MRIAILADVPWPSGAAGSVRVGHWARELARAGDEVAILPIGHYGAQPPTAAVGGFQLLREARYFSKYGLLGPSGIACMRSITSAINEFAPQWLLVYGRRLSTVAPCIATIAAQTRIALDMVEHPRITLWERGWWSPVGWDHCLGARLALARASCVFAITPPLAQACAAWTRAPISVVPGMIDAGGEAAVDAGGEAPDGTRDADAARNASPIIGYYGSWHAKDDPEFALAILGQLARASPHFRFQTIGRVPESIAARIAADAVLTARTTHLGFVPSEQLSATLGRWSAALLPRSDAHSTRFAFPNRCAELLAAGTPPAVRDCVGLAGYGLSEGVVLVPSADAQQAAAALLKALKADELAPRLRTCAMRFAAHALGSRHAVAAARAQMLRIAKGEHPAPVAQR